MVIRVNFKIRKILATHISIIENKIHFYLAYKHNES